MPCLPLLPPPRRSPGTVVVCHVSTTRNLPFIPRIELPIISWTPKCSQLAGSVSSMLMSRFSSHPAGHSLWHYIASVSAGVMRSHHVLGLPLNAGAREPSKPKLRYTLVDPSMSDLVS